MKLILCIVFNLWSFDNDVSREYPFIFFLAVAENIFLLSQFFLPLSCTVTFVFVFCNISF